jgi:hypothetical protein
MNQFIFLVKSLHRWEIEILPEFVGKAEHARKG